MSNLHKKLERLKELRQRSDQVYGSEVWRLGHDLAEAKFLPAKAYFLEGLFESNWAWRDSCISFLGYHYILDEDDLDRIRDVALTDPYYYVRRAAVYVLGDLSSLPEKALIKALLSDQENAVRKDAFVAILKLFKVSKKAIHREQRRIDSGEIQPTLEYIKQVLERQGIPYTPDMFNLLGHD
jgi:HEAT repeat protein